MSCREFKIWNGALVKTSELETEGYFLSATQLLTAILKKRPHKLLILLQMKIQESESKDYESAGFWVIFSGVFINYFSSYSQVQDL